MLIPNPYGLYCIVELNYNNVFVCNPLSYANGFMYTKDDNHLSGLTYSEFVTWLQRYMQEEFTKVYYYEPTKTLLEGIHHIANDVDYVAFIFYAYRTYGQIYLYVDQVGVEIVQGFGDELNEDDGHDSCIMGGNNEDKLDNLMDVGVDSASETVIMNKNIK